MNVEQHAEAILRAAGYHRLRDCYEEDRVAILAAVEAFGIACAEAMQQAAWLEVRERNDRQPLSHEYPPEWQRNQTRTAIRALDPAAIVKGM